MARSCVTQIIETIEEWTQTLDKGNSVDAVYLYFLLTSEEEQLEGTAVEKVLGIWVDNELGFKEHINKLVNKAKST